MATKKKETKDVAVVDEKTTAVTAAPAFLQKGKEGTEVLGQQDVELPWLKLLQGTTPGLNENGWRAGNFMHSIMEEEVLGAEGMEITIILALQPRYVLFNPIESGGGLLARAEDGVHWSPSNHTFEVKINKGTKATKWTTADTVAKSGLDKWGSYDADDPNSAPAADLQYRYICNSPTHPHFGTFILLLQRSGIKAAKRLNAWLLNSEYNSRDLVYNITSLWEDKGPNDKKFLWKFSPAGFVASEEASIRNKECYDQFKDADVAIHDEQSTATADTVNDAGAASTEKGKEDDEF